MVQGEYGAHQKKGARIGAFFLFLKVETCTAAIFPITWAGKTGLTPAAMVPRK